MAAPLTIIIPTLNCADRIGPCLARVFDGVAEGLVARVILSDGGSGDQIDVVADETGAELVIGEPGRGPQLARGADAAQSPWLLFLHADSQLPPDWCAAVRAHMDAGGGPAAFHLRFDQGGVAARLVAGWANMRSRWFKLPYGDQGLLIAGKDYRALGGFAQIPLMEDVEFARRVRPRPVLLPGKMTTSAAAYQREGWLRRGSKNLVILVKFLLKWDPKTLYSAYYGKK